MSQTAALVSNTLYDLRMERAVLGAILLNNREFDAVSALLISNDFSLESNRVIFTAIEFMIQDGQDVDYLTLGAFMGARNQLALVGGLPYISSLADDAPDRFRVESYCRRIADLAVMRRVAHVGHSLASITPSETTSVEVIEQARIALEEISSDTISEDTSAASFTRAILDKWLADRIREEDPGLPYGIPGLDHKTGGMYPGENTTVGGDPGHGKTSIALQAIETNCALGNPVFFVSLEMTREQVLKRLWANQAGIFPRKVRRPREANLVEAERVQQAALKIGGEWPLHVYDKSSVRLDQLTGMLRLAIRKHKVKLFIVDFVQIVASSGRDAREQISRASDQLTAVAKGEGVHLMLLSQLSRRGRQELNRPPRLSDLKESGALEQNAHTVVLIHRPHDEENSRVHSRAATANESGCELIVAKQREGSTGAIPVAFNEFNLRFEG